MGEKSRRMIDSLFYFLNLFYDYKGQFSEGPSHVHFRAIYRGDSKYLSGFQASYLNSFADKFKLPTLIEVHRDQLVFTQLTSMQLQFTSRLQYKACSNISNVFIIFLT